MKRFVRSVAVFTLLCLFPGTIIKASPIPSSFDLSVFYATIASNDTNELNALLKDLTKTDMPGKEAYEGALLMKKAGLLSWPKDKLSVFKSGREKLEAAIRKDPDNSEYRFLRLIIQENVPKIVRYKNNIKDDGMVVRTSFKKLPPIVQQAVRDYSKKSKTLTPSDF